MGLHTTRWLRGNGWKKLVAGSLVAAGMCCMIVGPDGRGNNAHSVLLSSGRRMMGGSQLSLRHHVENPQDGMHLGDGWSKKKGGGKKAPEKQQPEAKPSGAAGVGIAYLPNGAYPEPQPDAPNAGMAEIPYRKNGAFPEPQPDAPNAGMAEIPFRNNGAFPEPDAGTNDPPVPLPVQYLPNGAWPES